MPAALRSLSFAARWCPRNLLAILKGNYPPRIAATGYQTTKANLYTCPLRLGRPARSEQMFDRIHLIPLRRLGIRCRRSVSPWRGLTMPRMGRSLLRVQRQSMC